MEDIIDEIPKLTRPVLKRSTHTNPSLLKSYFTKCRNQRFPHLPLNRNPTLPKDNRREGAATVGSCEFEEFVKQILFIIGNEIHAQDTGTEENSVQTHKHFHKKLELSLKSQNKK